MNDCREYQILTRDGYGRVGEELKKKYGTYRANRVVWMIANGPIPEGMVVRHRCNNRACILLEHLVLGTPKDNSQDLSRSIVFCPNGHLYDADGSRSDKKCRQCNRERMRRKRD